MKENLFAGMMGGVGNEDYFFIGVDEKENQPARLLYLDPHLVSQQK